MELHTQLDAHGGRVNLTDENSSPFGVNNFDLIRLFAAAQVAHFHIFHIMGITIYDWHAEIIRFLGLFPGVPIFFFISGFLISKSWEKSPSLKHYTLNRLLRIYPALILAVCLSFVFIHISGYVAKVNPGALDLIVLFIAKASIIQFYNPEFMRGYGDGVMNGSLWTITVELQFYCLVPIIYLFLSKVKTARKNLVILVLVLIFLLINVVFNKMHQDFGENIIFKLFRVSFMPWFYMFLFGVFFQKNYDFFSKYFRGKFVYCFFGYIGLGLIFREFGASFGNSVNPIMYFLLAVLVFSAAYSGVLLSKKILRGADISYGVYIYHMPVVNYLLFTSYFSGYFLGAAAAIATLSISLLSWFLIEKNALKLKPKSIRPSLG